MKEEDLKYADFWSKVYRLGEKDPDVLTARRIIAETEPDFDAIDAMLTEEQHEQLISHMAACEAEFQALAIVAYEMGRSEGPRKPNETYLDWVENPEQWEYYIKMIRAER